MTDLTSNVSKKIIVTHFTPDTDAAASVWLLKNFHPGFADARIKFCKASETLDNLPVDSDPNVVHVDTGRGKFDHHQTPDKTLCAAKLVWNWIKKERGSKNRALDRMVIEITNIDWAKFLSYPDCADDKYLFFLPLIWEGWKSKNKVEKDQPRRDSELLSWLFECLDDVYFAFKAKVEAEETIQNGIEFKTSWGKGIGAETGNDVFLHQARCAGFVIAVRKDPQQGNVRIKAAGSNGVDLTKVYQKLKKLDPKATWFLHSSKEMILNGSVKHPGQIPTILSLAQIIEILEKP